MPNAATRSPMPLVRRAAFVLAIVATFLMVVPLSPSAEAVPLPTATDEIESFEAEDEDASAGMSTPEDATGQAAPAASRSKITEAPIPFSLIGFEMPEDAEAAFRTSVDGESWGDWTTVEPMDEEDGPDANSAEAVQADAKVGEGRAMSDGFWVEEARYVQVQVWEGDPTDVKAHVIDSNGLSASFTQRAAAALKRPLIDTQPPAAEATSRPSVRSRSSWDPNNDCEPRRGPSYASNARFVVVHHTAGSNTYTDGSAVVLGICLYHRDGNGWNDIGYNMLVDRQGNIYEGRVGGIERAVIGAHAAGFNTGSFGIAVMGNHDTAEVPQAAFSAVVQTIAWKSRLHGIDANGSVTAGGESIKTIVGHRDVGTTACPGRYFYKRMGELRTKVADRLDEPVDFSDISGSHAPFIRDIAEQGITVGCGGSRYCPDRLVTRGQMATFLLRAEGNHAPRWENRYEDVSTSHTHAPDINAIGHAEWTAGCNNANTKFCPSKSVTRAEMATFIIRAHPSLEPDPEGNRFNDVSESSSHRPFINALSDAGITVGCGNGSYCPDRPVTRAEMGTFLSRAMGTGLGG